MGERKRERREARGEDALKEVYLFFAWSMSQFLKSNQMIDSASLCSMTQPNDAARSILKEAWQTGPAKQAFYFIFYSLSSLFSSSSMHYNNTWIYTWQRLAPCPVRAFAGRLHPNIALNTLRRVLATAPAGAPSTRHRGLRGLT